MIARRTLFLAIWLLTIGVGLTGFHAARAQGRLYDWEALPDLPEPLGVAGACAGVSNGALIIAGGAHFPVSLFEGGTKVWTDSVYVLEQTPGGDYVWHTGYALDAPRGYSAALTLDDTVLCLGGGDARQHVSDVLSLRWERGRLVQERTLPPLPRPIAFAAAARAGETIYVAGGLEHPADSVAQRQFWALDLTAVEAGWRALPPWPGSARFNAVAAALDGAFYLISGTELQPDGQGGLRYRFLNDAYRYNPEKGWERLADLPWPAAAAPSPTPAYGPAHLLVFGGNDGSDVPRVQELKDRHPGFRREILAYHTITDTWAVLDTLPAAHVTTPLVAWEDRLVIPSGEIRPGTRSPQILSARPVPHTGSLAPASYLVLVTYFLLLVGIGIYFMRWEKSDEDFFLASGRIPWWAAGLSIFGTQLSAITYMAIPAKAYATDWVYILGQVSIVLIAPVIVLLYLPFFRRLRVTTAYEYLEKRFNVAVRLFGSFAFVLLQMGRMAVVIFLPALALSAATGIDIYLAILATGLLATLYTALGGIEAVVWSDVLQVIVLLGGAFLSLLIITLEVDGGFQGLLATAAADDKFHVFTWSWDYTTTSVWVVLLGNLLGNLVPYTADQTVVQRYLTTRDEKAAAQSIWTSALLTIPAAVIFFGLGTALYVFYKQHPTLLEPALPTDAIFPMFIVQQLPGGVAGLLVAGIFAAAMSSLDSSMNSVATVIVTDFYRRFISETTGQSRLRLARWLTLIFGMMATGTGLLLATYPVQSLWDLFLEILGLFGSSLAGLFALGIFTRRAHGAGALIGVAASIVVLYLVKMFTPIHFFLYAAIGIMTCFAVGYLASCLIPHRGQPLAGLTIYNLHPREKKILH
ncbi:MAG: sodium:solute symporter [Rhodothermaceae bacterium]|nr:MAG: sodium:solute symporter [Rhodothermaceae bacterium]